MELRLGQERPRTPTYRVTVVIAQLLVVILVIAIWETITRSGIVRPPILAPFSDTLASIWSLLQSASFYRHLTTTLVEIGVAYAIASVAGLALGLIIGGVRQIRETLEPIIVALYSIPIIILYPLFFLLFGLGPVSKIAFAGVYALFPIVLNTVTGFRNIDRALVVAAVSMGASHWQLYTKVILPAILPSIMAGMRIGANLTIIGVIGGEMLASTAGLGYAIQQAAGVFEGGRVYGLVLTVLVLATIGHVGLQQAENRLRKWEE